MFLIFNLALKSIQISLTLSKEIKKNIEPFVRQSKQKLFYACFVKVEIVFVQ